MNKSRIHKPLLAILIAITPLESGAAQSLPSIPEPDLILFGSLMTKNGLDLFSAESVAWSISDGTSNANITPR